MGQEPDHTDYRDLSEAEVYGRLDLNVEGDTPGVERDNPIDTTQAQDSVTTPGTTATKKQMFRNPWDVLVLALIFGAMGGIASAFDLVVSGLDALFGCLVFFAYQKVTSGASSK